MNSKKRRLLAFRGPVHHGRLMRPVEDAIERHGWEVVRYTAGTEACFQDHLQQECGLDGFKWLADYVDEAAATRLYQSHVPYFQGKLAEPNTLSLMLPQVLDRIIYFACQEFVATRNLLHQIKPAACLVLHELNRWSMELAAWAVSMNIPVWSLQEGMYYGDPWLYTGHTRYSRSLVWGEATKEILLKAGCAPERVDVLGHPDLSQQWQQAKQSVADGVLAHELPAGAAGKRLALTSLPHVALTDKAPEVRQGIVGSPWFLVARCHPLADLTVIQALRKLFGECPEHVWFSDLTLPFAHRWRLLAGAECMIAVGCSTAMLDWLWSGRPLGHISLPGEPRSLSAEGVAVPCDGAAGYLAAIEKTMAEWDDGYRARALAFVGREVADGAAAERIAQRIIEGIPHERVREK